VNALFSDGRVDRIGGGRKMRALMNVQMPARMSKAAFLDWVQGREERYELDRGASS
jgi:hypothetical protein